MIVDWDDAYVNAAYIPDGDAYPARWIGSAAAFRATRTPEVLAYGGHARERIDLFRPQGAARGLMVFVHGGYWRAYDRDVWSYVAAGPLARGWAVALPGYVLAPERRVAAIRRAVARAITLAAAQVAGPLLLVGHSAGGHLVARQVCDDSTLPPEVAARVQRVVPISGLHDLRPLLRTALGSELKLDRAEAEAESPALRWPVSGARVHAWVGAGERPEFVRQSELLVNIWTGLDAEMSLTAEPGRYHFDVIDALADPDSDLIAALVGD